MLFEYLFILLIEEWTKILIPVIINLLILLFIQRKITKSINRSHSNYEKGREAIEGYLSSLILTLKVSELKLLKHLDENYNIANDTTYVIDVMYRRINWLAKVEIYCNKQLNELVDNIENELMRFFVKRTMDDLDKINNLQENLIKMIKTNYNS